MPEVKEVCRTDSTEVIEKTDHDTKCDSINFEFRTDSFKLTAQGYLKLKAYATRTGIFKYANNGKIVSEYRPAQEVFKADSLETLKNLPLTRLHPPEFLNADNTNIYIKGYTTEKVDIKDNKLVGIDILVTDSNIIKEIQDKKLVELSCGYKCSMVNQPGTFNGEKYDSKQTNIIYNHLAMLPANWARGGNELQFKFDSKESENYRFDCLYDNQIAQKIDTNDKTKKEKKEVKTVKIRIDSIEDDVPDVIGMKIDAKLNELKEKTDSEKALKEKVDSLEKELAKEKDILQGKLDSLEDSLKTYKEKEATQAKNDALEKLKKLVPDHDFSKCDSVETAYKETLSKKLPNLDLNGKSNDYITSRIDSLLEALPTGNTPKPSPVSSGFGSAVQKQVQDSKYSEMYPKDNKETDRKDSFDEEIRVDDNFDLNKIIEQKTLRNEQNSKKTIGYVAR